MRGPWVNCFRAVGCSNALKGDIETSDGGFYYAITRTIVSARSDAICRMRVYFPVGTGPFVFGEVQRACGHRDCVGNGDRPNFLREASGGTSPCVCERRSFATLILAVATIFGRVVFSFDRFLRSAMGKRSVA